MQTTFEYFEVRKSATGYGLFAIKDIPKNTLLINIEGMIIPFRDTLKLEDEESYCLQIGLNKYIKPDYPFFCSNHSCKPNCGIKEDLLFVTIENVAIGEELRWDYSTSMLERSWTMKCVCGESTCRKMITDFDQLPIEIQRHYLKEKLVMLYIVQYLQTYHDA